MLVAGRLVLIYALAPNFMCTAVWWLVQSADCSSADTDSAVLDVDRRGPRNVLCKLQSSYLLEM